MRSKKENEILKLERKKNNMIFEISEDNAINGLVP